MPPNVQPTTRTSYLDPQTLATIGSLDLRARMIVEGVMSGMHRSPYQGFSVEFAQHRQYVPGDDTRFLDWKVFGRSDKLYLKQYQQETNLDLVLMVDVSGSMGFSSSKPTADARAWRKYDHAATLAAGLSYMSLSQQDRVGLFLFDNAVRSATRMSNVHEHWRNIAEALGTENIDRDLDGVLAGTGQTERTTDLSRLFDQMTAKLNRRSLCVLISDLFDQPEAVERGLSLLRFRGHDLIIFQVMDDAELNFPYRSPTDFIGLENEGRLGLDPSALKQAYLDALHAHLDRVQQTTRQFGFDYLLVNSSESLSAPLSRFLARRSAMMARGKSRK